MKEFDIEKAKAGAPVCTRDGRPARIVCFDAKGDSFIILALSLNENGIEIPFWYDKEGRCVRDNPNCDLMMATVKHEGWVLIHPVGPQCIAHIYDTKEEAEEDAEREMIDYSAIAHIEWEE